jgi:TetR/AcrR family transcriptional repressor of nem operon
VCPSRGVAFATHARARDPVASADPQLDVAKTIGHIRYVPQVSVRSRIVDSAMGVFLEKGFRGASIQDLVDAARVPKGSFYNHFSGKEELAVEITRRYVAAAGVDELFVRSVPPLQRLRAHLLATIERRARDGDAHGCLLGNFSTEVPPSCERLRAQVAGAFDQWTAAVAAVLTEAQQVGELGAARDPRALARYIVDGFEGATARAKVSGDRAVLTEFVDTTFDVLLA